MSYDDPFDYMPKGGGNGARILDRVEFSVQSEKIFLTHYDKATKVTTKSRLKSGDFEAVFDMPNIELGWRIFPPGNPPSYAMAKWGQPTPSQPNKEWKAAQRVVVLISGEEEARQLVNESATFVPSLKAVMFAYKAAPEAKAGKLPVVKIKGDWLEAKAGEKTFYRPDFVITGWVDRPAALAEPNMVGISTSEPAENEDIPFEVPPKANGAVRQMETEF